MSDQATFHVPARGLVVPSAEGPRFGPSIHSIPTAERKRLAIASLIGRTQDGSTSWHA